MSARRLTRALIALAVPALTVTALSAPATAAAKGPAVPSVAKVAKIYPHLAGGTSDPTSSKLHWPSKKCGKQGKVIKGAKATFALYSSADPADYAYTAAKPMTYVSAMKFRNAKDAIKYLHGTSKGAKCPVKDPSTGKDMKVKIKKIKFRLGDERWGYTATVTMAGEKSVSHSLLVREGKYIVSASAMSLDGKAPNTKKAIKLTGLALKTAS
ncbi:MAG TPA: hypothetical protein VMF51_18980 [Nocardioides sp.]|jgi:hypothetical protein|uniref:hypothetical protein n=1 Tax=Nocardioides sp. TaxID=35761 RepID=UPI002BCD5935|nr:hypothetical protein [Nocardioides sp.]HTW17222.1 hypothetical protein [Nocardioides sp.]